MIKNNQSWNYERIAKAITFINANFDKQPSLEKIASHINLSPFHCQRLFNEWAGTTPKKFLQFISLHHAKTLLKKADSVTSTTYKTGFSSTSRLHDLFIKLEGMTPSEYQLEGLNLTIEYAFLATPFGEVIVASTSKGVCHISFITERTTGINTLKELFPKAHYKECFSNLHQAVSDFMNGKMNIKDPIKLHVKGTTFQMKVWEALLQIPMGTLETYGQIAEQIGNPKAARAVGSAIGSNPIAYLIPCHRVIQSTGAFGGYMWGAIRKTAIIGWENAQLNK